MSFIYITLAHNANGMFYKKFSDLNNLRPVYNDVIQSLSYKEHISNITAKLKIWNNVLYKLVGTTSGANASTRRTRAPALFYSVEEYWHTANLQSVRLNYKRSIRYIDSQHHVMRLTSGCLSFIQSPWLPVLANIDPPAIRLRRETATVLPSSKGSSRMLKHDMPTSSYLHKWVLTTSKLEECGQRHIVNHIVNICEQSRNSTVACDTPSDIVTGTWQMHLSPTGGRSNQLADDYDDKKAVARVSQYWYWYTNSISSIFLE